MALILLCPAFGQTYNIRTFAGGGLQQNLPATSASLAYIPGVVTDTAGNLYLCLPQDAVVLRVDASTGVLTLVAGNGAPGFTGDNGPATAAQLHYP